MSDATALRSLREENDLLRERLRQLEDDLKPSSKPILDEYANAFRIGPAESRLLDLLMRREYVGREQYRHICPENVNSASLISVRIYYIRNSLGPLGIDIQNMWGRGYQLSPENKQRVRAAHQKWVEAGRLPRPTQYRRRKPVEIANP